MARPNSIRSSGLRPRTGCALPWPAKRLAYEPAVRQACPKKMQHREAVYRDLNPPGAGYQCWSRDERPADPVTRPSSNISTKYIQSPR